MPCPGLQSFDYAAAKASAPGLDIGRGTRQAPRGRGRGNRGVHGGGFLSKLLDWLPVHATSGPDSTVVCFGALSTAQGSNFFCLSRVAV